MSKRKEIGKKMASVEKRYGKTLGASKGSKPPPKPKVKPVIGKDDIGFNITKKT